MRGWFLLVSVLAATPLLAQEVPLAGTWDVTFSASLASQRWTLDLEGSGQRLAGSMDMGPLGTTRIRQLVLSGNRLRLEYPFASHGFSGVFAFVGRVEDGLYRGEMSGYPGTTRPVPFRAVHRTPSVSAVDGRADTGVAGTEGRGQPASAVREIAMRSEHGWFVVPVVVDGDTLSFILDTGAGVSTVTVGSAARLRLAEGELVTAQGASGAQQMRMTTLPSLTFGGVTSSDVRVLVLPDQVITPTPDGANQFPPFDGVVGVDLFGAFDVFIDPLAGLIRLYGPGETPAPALLADLSDPLPLRRVIGHLIGHDVQVNGVIMPAVVDTGARYVVLNLTAAESAGVAPTGFADAQLGVGGQVAQMSDGFLQTLQMGTTEVGPLGVRIGDLPVFVTAGFRGGPVVLLGNPAFRGCPMFISYPTNTIRYCRAIR